MKIVRIFALALLGTAAWGDTTSVIAFGGTQRFTCCDAGLFFASDENIVNAEVNGHFLYSRDPNLVPGVVLVLDLPISHDTADTWVFSGGSFQISGGGDNTNGGSPMLPGYQCVDDLGGGCAVAPRIDSRFIGYFVGDVTVDLTPIPAGFVINLITGPVAFTVDPAFTVYGGSTTNEFSGILAVSLGDSTLTGTSVPEPASLVLLGGILIYIAFFSARHPTGPIG